MQWKEEDDASCLESILLISHEIAWFYNGMEEVQVPPVGLVLEYYYTNTIAATNNGTMEQWNKKRAIFLSPFSTRK